MTKSRQPTDTVPEIDNIQRDQKWFRLLILTLLLLGIFFRFFDLDHKVYDFDEVYTSFRAAGFTSHEIYQEIFQNRLMTPDELQTFQRLKPGSTVADTVRSLTLEDPQHPPLYFLMARFWMQALGSSITASRTLPALFGLLALPLMYGLALELFASRSTAILATAILAISPFDILSAQTVRQYSLLTACIIGSSFLLLRALRLSSWQNWSLYSLTCVIGLYTQPLFSLGLIAHGSFVIGHWLLAKDKRQKTPLKYLVAATSAFILYIPWMIVMKSNYQQAITTTSWVYSRMDVIDLFKRWILSFTTLFLDLDIRAAIYGSDSAWTYLIRVPFVLLIAGAIYTVCRQTSRSTYLFILTSIFVPFGMLALPDLLLCGQRSAISRYLIPCWPGVQLAVAYFMASKALQVTPLQNRQRFWRGVLALVLTASLVSCTASFFSDTWWVKDQSYFNGIIARTINTTKSPLIISDRDDWGMSMGDLIALSYLLANNVRLLLLDTPPKLGVLQEASVTSASEIFLFRPSWKLYETLEAKTGRLEYVSKTGGRLVRLLHK